MSRVRPRASSLRRWIGREAVERLEARSMPVVGAFGPLPTVANDSLTTWYSGVVRLLDSAGGYSTGTLIDDRHVLTAAHNVSVDNGTVYSPLPGGIDVTVELPPIDYQVPGATVKAIPLTFHVDPSHIHLYGASSKTFAGDLALLTLDDPVPGGSIPTRFVPVEGVHVFPLATAAVVPGPNVDTTLAGYGKGGTGGSGWSFFQPSGVKRIGRNTLDGSTNLLRDEVVSVEVLGNPTTTKGTFTLQFKGSTTAPIPVYASASAVEAALAALPTVGKGNVKVRNEPGVAGQYLVEFTGALGGQVVDPFFSVKGAVTGPGKPGVRTRVWYNPQDRLPKGVPIPEDAGFVIDFDNGEPAHDALGLVFGISGLGLRDPESFIGPADSGSPVLVNSQVVGVYHGTASFGSRTGVNPDVNTRSDSTFGEFGVANSVTNPAYQKWIRDTLQADDQGPFDLELDLSRQAFGADKVSDTLGISVSTSPSGVLSISVENASHRGSRYNGVYTQVDALRVHDLIIKGTDDHESVSINGSLGIKGQLRFEGGKGDDNLTLNLTGAAKPTVFPQGGVFFDGGDGNNSLTANDTVGAGGGGTVALSQVTLNGVASLVLTGNAHVVVDRASTFKNLTLQHKSTLTLNQPLAVDSDFQWWGGTIRGATDLVVSPRENLTVISSQPKKLDGARLVNNGTIRVIGTGDLTLTNGATIRNENVVDIQVGMRFAFQPVNGASGAEQFLNNGLLLTSRAGIVVFGGGGTPQGALVNTNLVRVASGTTLRLTGGASGAGLYDVAGALQLGTGRYDFPAGSLVSGSGTLSTSDALTIGGTVSMSGPISLTSGTISVADGARLGSTAGITIGSNATVTGDGTLVGNVQSTGTINPGLVGGLGTLTIEGDLTQNVGTIVVELDANGQSDLLKVTRKATFFAGRLSARALDPDNFRPASGTRYTVLSAGSLAFTAFQVSPAPAKQAPPPARTLTAKVELGPPVTITYRDDTN